MGDPAGGYLVGLRAGQGVCSEIDRSQSRIPMSSIALCDIVVRAKMALADDIELLVSRRPGLTELALAKFLFGRTGYQQRVNSTCRHLLREGHVERHGTGASAHVLIR
jgi:hypothetical protein